MNLRMVALPAGLLVMGIQLLACGGPSPKPKAAQSLGCPEKQIQVDTTQGITMVTGCGKTDIMPYDNGRNQFVSLREQASYEMNCPGGELDVKLMTSMSYGVRGCGKRALYKLIPYVGLTLDSMQPDGDAAAAPPAAAAPAATPAS